jgi:hypothetical protein
MPTTKSKPRIFKIVAVKRIEMPVVAMSEKDARDFYLTEVDPNDHYNAADEQVEKVEEMKAPLPKKVWPWFSSTAMKRLGVEDYAESMDLQQTAKLIAKTK